MDAARSLTVKLETVTPLFLAGAEPRGAPELRPPAFRGALRYWLRAVLGGVLGDDIAAVRAAEAAVFGSTDEREGGAGAITIRIRHESLLKPESFPKPGRPPSGRDYLYWSMAESGRADRGNYLEPKQFLPEGSTFDLVLTPRPGALNQTTALERAACALWLLVHLGGIGSRSRRTAGSVAVQGDVEFHGLRFAPLGNSAASITRDLGAGLRRVRAICATMAGGSLDRAVTAPASFDILHPATCRIWVLGVWSTTDAAVQTIGGWLREARAALPLHQRAVYGLPTQGVDARGVDRRASPLWLTLVPIADGRFAGIATLFRSQLLPAQAQIWVNGQRSPLPTGYGAIETAIAQWMTSGPGGVEVRYG